MKPEDNENVIPFHSMPEDPNKINVPCPKGCRGVTLSFPQPEMQVYSHPMATIIHILHTDRKECVICGGYYALAVPGVQGGNILMAIVEVPKPQEASRIVGVPPGMKIPKSH